MRRNEGKRENKNPLWLMINAITISELLQRLFEKSAKEYKIDWSSAEKMSIDERTDFVFEHTLTLYREYPSCYLDFYSSLRYALIAVRSRPLQKLMVKMRERPNVKSKFFRDEFRWPTSPGVSLTHPANFAAWYCSMEHSGLQEEWRQIVDLVNKDESGRLVWRYFNITAPQNIDEEEIKEGLELFKKEFGKTMEERKGMDFPVEIHPFPSTGKYVRYVINVPKDPTKAFLVNKKSVSVGLDPTMNTFYIDHYFAEDKIRVSWPVMCEERDAAEHFAKFVLGSEIVDEVVLYFTKPLRAFTSSRESKELMKLSEKDKESICSIKISAVDFTYAESESEAEKIRRQKENISRKKVHDELRPAFKCYNYKGDDIWRYLDEHFNPLKYKAEWRDVLSLKIQVELYAIVANDKIRYYDRNKKRKFSIICKPNKLDYAPKLHEIAEPEYKATLRYIAEKKLKLVGQTLSEQVQDANKDGADGSVL